MKKVILIFFSALLICTIANAQYKIDKTKYDYRTYTHQAGDPYSPGGAGFASFLIPGLGQMFSGEASRGSAFLGSYLGCAAAVYVGYTFWNRKGHTGLNSYWQFEAIPSSPPPMIFILGIAGMVIIDICSIADAVHVAKVNNLAFRDKNKTSLNLKISPDLNLIAYGTTSKLTTGISLKLIF